VSDGGESRRRRVAILGGGAGGLAAAFELSQPDWREHFESITVYQLGWRLGGKGASGRGDHGRIEEHGLHLWLGFYHNAFRMMQECYDELGRRPSTPLATLEDAFERASLFVVQEPRPQGWVPWPALFPSTDEMPGASASPSLWQLLVRALELAVAFVRSTSSTSNPAAVPPRLVPPDDTGRAWDAGPVLRPGVDPLSVLADGIRDIQQTVTATGRMAIDVALAAALALAGSLGGDPTRHHRADHDRLRSAIETAADEACHCLSSAVLESDEARRNWFLFEILLACARGVLFHGLLTKSEGLSAIDGFDFVDWLILNGASPAAARSPLVKTIVYDLPFAYRDGRADAPSASAASALQGLFRMFFDYRGAIAWKMRAGMGDAVFAPLYQVLKSRGVRFEFFHRVHSLHLNEDRTRIDRIDIGVQVEVRDKEAGYQPLIEVKGLPCWPNEPLNDQLCQPVTASDVESFWSGRTDASTVTLHDGKDFDEVVLAIPVGALGDICKEIIDGDRRWVQMVDKLATVNTQSFQLWLSRPMDELGVEGPPTTIGGYLEPFDTCADMRQVISQENWPPGAVQAIGYFCNVMPTPRRLPGPDDLGYPARAEAEVKANAISFLDTAMVPLWPGAVKRYPTGFRWDLLVGAGQSAGPEVFDTQFWRANIDPWERYVLSLPGTMRYRLYPDDSGYRNLTLAGDWTRCGLNAGYVEAAVTAGMVASNHLRRRPQLERIVTFGGL